MKLDRLLPLLSLPAVILALSFGASDARAIEPEEPTEMADVDIVEPEHLAVEPTDLEVDEPITAGLWIFLDPETGRQRPTPTPEQAERMRSWAASFNKSDKGLEPFVLPNGGTGVHLRGRYRHALMAFVNDRGDVGYTCSDHAAEAPPAGTPEVDPEGVDIYASAPEQ